MQRARILDFLGHDVTRANHVGDWGAQFGSLLAYMDQLEQSGEILSTELKDLEVFYKKASALFKSDEEFAIRARAYVVRLQSGDDRCLELWQQFISESINHCQGVYDKLNITLTRQDIKAESSYNDDLAVVVSELKDKGLLEISDGAKCVFLEEFKGKDDKPLPAIVQKSDGGYPLPGKRYCRVAVPKPDTKRRQRAVFHRRKTEVYTCVNCSPFRRQLDTSRRAKYLSIFLSASS